MTFGDHALAPYQLHFIDVTLMKWSFMLFLLAVERRKGVPIMTLLLKARINIIARASNKYFLAVLQMRLRKSKVTFRSRVVYTCLVHT